MSRARIIIICVLAFLLLLAIAVPTIVSATYRSKAEGELALLRAEGGSRNVLDLVPMPLGRAGREPLTLLSADDFKAVFPKGGRQGTISDFKNAKIPEATKIYAAYDQFSRWTPAQHGATASATSPAAFNDDWLPWLDRLAADNGAFLDRVRQTASAGNAVFAIDWTQGANTLLPHLSRVRESARVLRVDAYVRMRKGDVAGAMEDVRAMLRLRGLIDTDPVVISKLVACAVDSITLTTLVGIVEEGHPGRASVEAVLADLAGREERNSLTSALLGETAMDLDTFELIARDPDVYRALRSMASTPQPTTTEAHVERYLRTTAFRATWLRRADEYHFLQEMRALRERSRMPFPRKLSASPAAAPTNGVSRRLTGMMVPPLHSLFGQEARSDLALAKTRLALALYLYKVDNGAWPASLDALVPRYLPQLPASPYDGKPLQCRFTADAYVIEAADELDAAKKNSQ